MRMFSTQGRLFLKLLYKHIVVLPVKTQRWGYSVIVVAAFVSLFAVLLSFHKPALIYSPIIMKHYVTPDSHLE